MSKHISGALDTILYVKLSDILDVATGLLIQARQHNEALPQLLFMITPEQEGLGLARECDMDTRELDFRTICMDLIIQKNADCIAYVAESSLPRLDPKDKDHQVFIEKINAGEMRVCELPQEYLADTLMLLFYDQNGNSKMDLIEIKQDENGMVELIDFPPAPDQECVCGPLKESFGLAFEQAAKLYSDEIPKNSTNKEGMI